MLRSLRARFSLGRSLAGRVAIGTILIVAVTSIAAGYVVVKATERRDRRDFDADLRRVIGNLEPDIFGSVQVLPRKIDTQFAPAPIRVFSRQRLIATVVPPRRPPPPSGPGSPPKVSEGAASLTLAIGFAATGRDASPAGAIAFLRATSPLTGYSVEAGTVPRGFPSAQLRTAARTVTVDGTQWRDVSEQLAPGVFADVGAKYRLSARAAGIRRVVIWASLIGVALAAIAAILVTRVSLRPLRRLREEAVGITGTEDLRLRVSHEGQPAEVAALAEELDGMLARISRSASERQAALEAARRFAADVGHELRTPLQSVRSSIEIASRHDVSGSQLETALRNASSQSERLHRLVDGLQSLARGEAGLESSVGSVDLGDIVDGAVFIARVRHPNLAIEVRAPEQGPTIVGDADGLWRVVDNLVENAARHGRADGHVRISVSPLARGAEILVEDDGPGIPAQERERVRERFARGSDASVQGSGLGLAIVHAEAHRHGGSLGLSDSPLGGLAARVTLGGAPPAPTDAVDEPASVRS